MKVKLAALFFASTAGFAVGGPKVVVDIPPIHSLVSSVMGDVGTPELILQPGASPHGYAMAPSEARALAAAEVVFWVSPTLTPWLDRAIENLSPDARSIELIHADDIRVLPFREGALFEAHDHDHHDDHDEEHGENEDHHDEHAHDESGHDEDRRDDEHAEDGHDDEHAEDGQDEDGHDEHAHDEGGQDPHIWLDPRNAQAMTRAIVVALSDADRANATTYGENGAALIAELRALEVALADTVAGAKKRPFIVFHDAYHYFEARFDVEASGAISISDAAAPGPARLTEIREAIGGFGAPCIFTEPQFPKTNALLVMEGTDAKLAILDPMGAALLLGPDHYGAMMRGMAEAMATCLVE